jgi:hypothetical protein
MKQTTSKMKRENKTIYRIVKRGNKPTKRIVESKNRR